MWNRTLAMLMPWCRVETRRFNVNRVVEGQITTAKNSEAGVSIVSPSSERRNSEIFSQWQFFYHQLVWLQILNVLKGNCVQSSFSFLVPVRIYHLQYITNEVKITYCQKLMVFFFCCFFFFRSFVLFEKVDLHSSGNDFPLDQMGHHPHHQ